MIFNRDNVKVGITVSCSDSNHPMKARNVIGYSSDSCGVGVLVKCDCGVGFHSNETRLFYFSEITAIVPDEPWRAGVGKRVSLEGGTVGKYLGKDKDGAHIIQREDGKGWSSDSAEANITPIGTPNCWWGNSYQVIEEEWLPLTKENVSKYLAVGDEIQIDCHPNKYRKTISEIWGRELHVVGGSFFWIDEGYHFRIIKKAVREETKSTYSTLLESVPPLTMETLEKAYKTLYGQSIAPTSRFYSPSMFNHFITKPPQGRITKYMSDFSRKAKLLALSISNPDQKLLVENGLKTIDGEYTSTFLDEVREREAKKRAEKAEAEDKALKAEYEAIFIAELKAIAEAEEKKK